MGSRLPCKHETWARRQHAATRENHEPLVMGPTPHCPWCARESGEKLADGLMSKLTAENAQLRDLLEKAERVIRAAWEENEQYVDGSPSAAAFSRAASSVLSALAAARGKR